MVSIFAHIAIDILLLISYNSSDDLIFIFYDGI